MKIWKGGLRGEKMPYWCETCSIKKLKSINQVIHHLQVDHEVKVLDRWRFIGGNWRYSRDCWELFCKVCGEKWDQENYNADHSRKHCKYFCLTMEQS